MFLGFYKLLIVLCCKFFILLLWQCILRNCGVGLNKWVSWDIQCNYLGTNLMFGMVFQNSVRIKPNILSKLSRYLHVSNQVLLTLCWFTYYYLWYDRCIQFTQKCPIDCHHTDIFPNSGALASLLHQLQMFNFAVVLKLEQSPLNDSKLVQIFIRNL